MDITCTVMGVPMPTQYWIFGSSPVPFQHSDMLTTPDAIYVNRSYVMAINGSVVSTLHVVNVQLTHIGEYHCVGTNNYEGQPFTSGVTVSLHVLKDNTTMPPPSPTVPPG